MLGNDVVDLRDPEARTRHPRFDARVFREAERAALAASTHPHALRQALWAAKEAAYKAAKRMDPSVVFSPVRFEVDLSAAGRGCVHHGAQRFDLRVHREGDCIHALACLGVDPCRSRHGILRTTPGRASADVRRAATQHLARAFEIDAEELSVQRHGRLPELAHRGKPLGIPLTLSHHGRFAAYAALNRTHSPRNLH